ncbi:MAG: hypothetical protein ACRDZ0_11990 [Acidimicrobiales bacterium]
MSSIFSWRRIAPALALLIAAAGIVALRSSSGVDAAQPAGSTTVVFSNLLVTPSNGHLVIPELGEVDGVLGIACTGAVPRTGMMIPGQVVTQLGFADARLRIMRNDGAAITGTVRINCVIEFGSIFDSQAAAERLG